MSFLKRLTRAESGSASSSAPPPWLTRARAATQGGLMLAAEATGVGLSVVAAPLAAFTGKLYVAVLVAAFGLGCGLRFVRLRQKRRQGSAPMSSPRQPTPVWLTPAVLFVSTVEMALLVEATRWPVRADQPGFEPINWVWVIVGFLVLVGLQRGWLLHRLHAVRLNG